MSEPTRYEKLCKIVEHLKRWLGLMGKSECFENVLKEAFELLAEWKASHEKDKADNSRLLSSLADLAHEHEAMMGKLEDAFDVFAVQEALRRNDFLSMDELKKELGLEDNEAKKGEVK